MAVTVIVPWRPSGPDRGRAWAYVNRWWADHFPTLPVRTALAPAGAWCKARAVMPAVEAATADIIVVTDADVTCDGITDAIAAVQDGAPWAIPHDEVHRLTKRGTDQLLDGKTTDLEVAERPYRGVQGGGIVVATRATLLNAPLDARFTGWGQEDQAWAIALLTLAGLPWRGTADLLHLYHPPLPRLSRVHGSSDGVTLYRRYIRARRDPPAMRRLIEEGRRHDPCGPDEPAVHDHAA